jgi:hypothetical protein
MARANSSLAESRLAENFLEEDADFLVTVYDSFPIEAPIVLLTEYYYENSARKQIFACASRCV